MNTVLVWLLSIALLFLSGCGQKPARDLDKSKSKGDQYSPGSFQDEDCVPYCDRLMGGSISASKYNPKEGICTCYNPPRMIQFRLPLQFTPIHLKKYEGEQDNVLPSDVHSYGAPIPGTPSK